MLVSDVILIQIMDHTALGTLWLDIINWKGRFNVAEKL